MKLTNLLSVPFAIVADVVTLGNMGDESFTNKVFRNDREERQAQELLKALEFMARIKDE
jgi:hypothetical protein